MTVLYIHGKGGSADEAGHYRPLFPGCDVRGLDYQTFTPWETGAEIRHAVRECKQTADQILLIANSIGAFFSMCAGIDGEISRAWFVSPIVDMERLIEDMMRWAGVTEPELQRKGTIRTSFGEDLSWDYLCYVRAHPPRWDVPTQILYGSQDRLTSRQTVEAFANAHHAGLTVMDGGGHWFHTPQELAFLDNWIRTTQKG